MENGAHWNPVTIATSPAREWGDCSDMVRYCLHINLESRKR